jgi:hypothetical protein
MSQSRQFVDIGGVVCFFKNLFLKKKKNKRKKKTSGEKFLLK